MMSRSQYSSCLGLLSNALVELHRDEMRVEVPPAEVDGTPSAIREKVRSVLARHGQVRSDENKFIIPHPNTERLILEEGLREALSTTIKHCVAGPDIAGLFKPDEWPTHRALALYVDAAYNPDTGNTGIGVRTSLLAPSRQKTEHREYCFKLPDQPGSHRAEQLGILCGLGVAAHYDFEHVMVANDSFDAVEKLSTTHSGIRYPGAVNLYEGLSRSKYESPFESVRLLKITRSRNKEADRLARKGQTHEGRYPWKVVDVPEPLERRLRTPDNSAVRSTDLG